MGHCAGTNRRYAVRVAAGEGYFYRVLQPQRVTLFISRRSGSWQVEEEVSGDRNAAVGAAACDRIGRWLRGAGASS